MKKLILLVTVLLSFPFSIFSQKTLTLPFESMGGLVVVQARVNGLSGNFVLDTGVEHLVLNRNYFRGRSSNKTFHHILGAQSAGEYNYVDLELGTGYSKKVYADIINLEQVEHGRDRPIHGLIGTHVLRSFDLVYFDLKKQLLLLVDQGGNNALAPPFGLPARDTLPLQWKGYMPAVSVSLDGKTLQVALDTGAEMNLIGDEEKDLLLGFLPSSGHQVTLRGFGKATRKAAIAKFRGMRVGARPCPPLHFAFASLDGFNKLLRGKPISGILNPKAFGAMRWAISFRKKEMYLWGAYPERDRTVLAFVGRVGEQE